MIVCYSKKWDKRFAIEFYNDKGPGEKYFLLAIGKRKPFYSYLLIKADSLEDAYNKYSDMHVSKATLLSQQTLNMQFMQKGRHTAIWGMNDIELMVDDIKDYTNDPDRKEDEVLDLINEIAEYAKEVYNNIQEAEDWNTDSIYIDEVVWLKSSKSEAQPHTFEILIEEEIPIEQIRFNHSEIPKELLKEEPFEPYEEVEEKSA